MTTFETFKSGPAKGVLKKIGFDLSRCKTWRDYTDRFIDEQNRLERIDEDDTLTKRAERAFLSTGEMSVMIAALHAADYSRQADELCEAPWSQKLQYGYEIPCETLEEALCKFREILDGLIRDLQQDFAVPGFGGAR